MNDKLLKALKINNHPLVVLIKWLSSDSSNTPKNNLISNSINISADTVKIQNPSDTRLSQHSRFISQVIDRDNFSKQQAREKAQRFAERDIAITDQMSGREFEIFIAEVYEDLGYKSKLTPESGDQGVDILINDFLGKKIAVQTKRYTGSVGNAAVQEVIAGRIFYGCSKAIVVTNSTFTKSAAHLARQDGNVELIDRVALAELIYKSKHKTL